MLKGIFSSVSTFSSKVAKWISPFPPPTQQLSLMGSTIPAGMTYARASSKNIFNNQGLLTTIGTNVPGFEYDPVLRTLNGLSIEEQRTNLCLQSNTMNTSWTVNGQVTPTAAGIITPDGTSGAWQLTENTATSVHELFQTIAHVNGTTYSRSGIFKAGTRTWITLSAFDSVTGFGRFFDIQNGVVGSVVPGGTAPTASGMQNLGNGWWRCWITYTAGASGGNVYCGLATGDTVNSYLGNSSFVYAYHQQEEAGPCLTSPIFTTTTTVTRAVDSLVTTTLPGFNAANGAASIEVMFPLSTINGTRRALEFSDGSLNNRYFIDNLPNASSFIGTAEIAGAFFNTTANGTITANTVQKSIISWGSLVMSSVTNGGSAFTVSYSSVPALTTLNLGTNQAIAASINGWLRNCNLWNTTLQTSQQQAATR